MPVTLADSAGVFADRILVYLDTADYSYLQDDVDRDAANALQALGREGIAAFVLTPEHFVEVAGLADGLPRRVQYMRQLSGAFWLGLASHQVLELEAQQFASHVLGGKAPTRQYPGGWFESQPEEEVMKGIAVARLGRQALEMYVRAEQASRLTRGNRPSQKEDAKLLTQLRGGDVNGLNTWLKRKGMGKPGLRGRMQRLAISLAVRGLRAAERGRLIPALEFTDPAFERTLANVLPREIRSNRKAMRKLHDVWRDEEARARIAPSLSCVAALETASYRRTQDAYKLSTLVDRMHAAFAPLVEVYTCDKRNVELLQRTLRLGRSKTRVLRTRRLPKIVQVVAQLHARL